MIIILLIFSAKILFAQYNYGPWNQIRNSAITENGNIFLRCETNPISQTEFLFRNDDYMWHSQVMETLQGTTHQAGFPFSMQNHNYCRFKNNTNGFITMLPAYIPENSIPQHIETLGFIAEDDEGDTTAAPSLDIVNTYIGYSDMKIFGGLQNATNSYPTNSGGVFPSEFYLYIIGLINLETAYQDSVMYGMVYCNIPFFLSSGLYKIIGTDLSFDSIQRIGNISQSIVNGVLVVSCNWEDLISDEHFGQWPSLSNSLGFEFITHTIDLEFQPNIADYSTPSIQIFHQYIIEPFENYLPEINDVGYTINIDNTSVWFSYFDENSHFPISVNLHVDSSIYQMLPSNFDFSAPVIFATTFPATNWEEAIIRVSDNGYEFVEHLIQNNATVENDILLSSFQLTNFPNPFNPITTIQFNVELFEPDDLFEIEIFDIKGRQIRQFKIQNPKFKTNEVIWDGTDHHKKQVPSGVYLYRLRAGEYQQINKMILLK
jgi:hypothetical protein